MKIGITSQNFRSITAHAGKTRRFLVLVQDTMGKPTELERIDLPKEMSLHEYHGDDHPIFKLDVLVTGSSGDGFIRRMQAHGVQVIATSETDPYKAASSIFAGEDLPPAEPHAHNHGQQQTVMPTH